ncbi:hypothetical protein AWB67_05929 [Caballeronia terrestris]|uniref:Uncharacterized protein n=1 Tax=Caballeronia terrestris TaxID=1226301 RepID=A0A158KMF7_9BURK|nr:hypothetical protein [Caballeronia terrestris]SAL81750.1 hypothetical protein AWB67_05929 [Caballeronia terrestris]
MIDFANNNYQSNQRNTKGQTKRVFLITLIFILGGLSLVIADHAGHDLQAERVATNLR